MCWEMPFRFLLYNQLQSPIYWKILLFLLAIHNLLQKWKVICIDNKGGSSFCAAAFRASRDISFKRRGFSYRETYVAVVSTYFKISQNLLNVLSRLWNFSFDSSPRVSTVQSEFEDLSASFIAKRLWAKLFRAPDNQDAVEGAV